MRLYLACHKKHCVDSFLKPGLSVLLALLDGQVATELAEASVDQGLAKAILL